MKFWVTVEKRSKTKKEKDVFQKKSYPFLWLRFVLATAEIATATAAKAAATSRAAKREYEATLKTCL